MAVKSISDAPVDPVEGGDKTYRQVLIGDGEGPNFSMRRFVLEPGGGMPCHTNSVEHEQYVLKGRARIGIGEDQFEVGANDVVFIPAEAPHWYQVVGDEAFEFLCMVPNKPDEMKLVESDS